MATERSAGLVRAGFVARSPLGPIANDAEYRAVIAILDRLFARDKRRRPGELAYFRWLARLARGYEIAPAARRRRRPDRGRPAGRLHADGR